MAETPGGKQQDQQKSRMSCALEVCADHSGTCYRILAVERALEKQDSDNSAEMLRMWTKIDKMSDRLNLIMGGVFVLWPALQLALWFFGGKKP